MSDDFDGFSQPMPTVHEMVDRAHAYERERAGRDPDPECGPDIEEAIAHLGAARAQLAECDDKIIAAHIDAAYNALTRR